MTAIIDNEAAARAWLREKVGATDADMGRLEQLIDLLVAENERQNLIARGTIPMIWQRQYRRQRAAAGCST